jgi:2-dehydro-3-deoxyphosphogalactonate aldolase
MRADGLIVSPNYDAEVVRETKRLGLQSFPGRLHPDRGIRRAEGRGRWPEAFPRHIGGPRGLKAMRAVLPPGTQVYAVGGAGAENFGDWIAAGADGFGIGTALYVPGLSVAEIGARARRIVEAYDTAVEGIAV